MLAFLAPVLLMLQGAVAAPVASNTAAAATVGKIRGVRDPIYHLYLQASPKNGMSNPRRKPFSPQSTPPPQTLISIYQKSNLSLHSIHPRPRPRIRRRRIHHRWHHSIQKDEPLPQHPERHNLLQTPRLGQGRGHNGVGTRRGYDHHRAGKQLWEAVEHVGL